MNNESYYVVDIKDAAGVKICSALTDSNGAGIDEDHIIKNTYGDNSYGWTAMCPKIQETLANMQSDEDTRYTVYGVGVPESSKPQDFGPNVECKNLYTDSKATYMEKTYDVAGIGSDNMTNGEMYTNAYIRDPKNGMDQLAGELGHTPTQRKIFKDGVRAANQEAKSIRQEGPEYERAEAYAAILKDQAPIENGVKLINIPEVMPSEYAGVSSGLVSDVVRGKQSIWEEPSLINCQNRSLIFVGNEEMQAKLHGIETEDGIGVILKESNAPLAQKDIDAVTKGVTGLAEKELLTTNPAVTHDAVENDHTMSGDIVNTMTGAGQAMAETASEAVENAPDNYTLKTFQDGETRLVNDSEEAQLTGTEVIGSPDGVNEESIESNTEAEAEEEEEEEKKVEASSAVLADAAENLVDNLSNVESIEAEESQEMAPELEMEIE